MEVRKTHHVDKGEPDQDGLYDYFYEFDLYSFSEGDLSIIARSYADEPKDAYISGIERDGNEILLEKTDLVSPLFCKAIEYLRKEGKTSLRYLSVAGYEAVESKT